MNKILTASTCLCFSIFLFTGCIVSKKKYLAETARADKEHNEKVDLNNRLSQQIALNNRLNGNIKDLKNDNANLNSTIAILRDSVKILEGNIHEGESRIHDLKNKISLLGNQNQDANEQLNMTKAEIAAQRKHLEQLQSFIDQQQAATEALRKKIADALVGFNSNELTITMKNGRVYISMQEGLLFPSGSAVVNPKGKEALSKVASVLNTGKDVNIDIEGHTDSLPIHTKMYEDNWSLSTARATSIAHVLIDEYHVTPARLVASGRSEYDPVATNSTPEGRALNRRTEIILEPKLDELMQLMNKPAHK
ncbi:MAG: OmpA family protein [Chitinophagales bacterium]